MGGRTASLAVAGLTIATMALAGCSSTDQQDDGRGAATSAGVRAIATTTVWGDITGQIVECVGSGEASTLMPIGADPHDYAPSSKDVASMVSADIVIANGLDLEEGLEQSLASAQADGATVVEVAPQLDPLPFTGDDDGHAEDPAEHDDHSGDDPHVWLDVARTARAAAIIGAELTRTTGNPDYAECGTLLEGELMILNDEVAATLARVPADGRILVTDHDALGYLAAAYGYTVAGTVVPGGSTLAEPSSAELAALTATVQETGVPAIFANTADPQALVDALASEVGDVAVVDLYVGSLGAPGSEAGTYQQMMTTNAQRISGALAG
jgi:zinc/manganese transport system substrate-binding protein